jgi:hypothetical protein
MAAAVEGSIVVRRLGQLSHAVSAVFAAAQITEQWELRRRYTMSVITDIVAVELAEAARRESPLWLIGFDDIHQLTARS